MNGLNTISPDVSFDDFFGAWVTPWWQRPWWVVLFILLGLAALAGMIYLVRWLRFKKKSSLSAVFEEWLAIDSTTIDPKIFYFKAMATLKMVLRADALTERQVCQLLAQAQIPAEELLLLQGLVERAAVIKYDQTAISMARVNDDKACLLSFLRAKLEKKGF